MTQNLAAIDGAVSVQAGAALRPGAAFSHF
jgi:hypothetical protein